MTTTIRITKDEIKQKLDQAKIDIRVLKKKKLNLEDVIEYLIDFYNKNQGKK